MKISDTVITNFQETLAFEAHQALQVHADWAVLRFMRLKRLIVKMEKYGERLEGFVAEVTNRVLRAGVAPQYDAGTITAPDLADQKPSVIFAAQLEREYEIVAALEGHYADAISAADADDAHLIKTMIHHHRKHIEWLEAQLRMIATWGEVDYMTTVK